jgi:hypothetical protein
MNYFLVIFINFFIFWIQIQIWILGPVATARYRYRTPAVATVTAVYRAVTSGKKTLLQSLWAACTWACVDGRFELRPPVQVGWIWNVRRREQPSTAQRTSTATIALLDDPRRAHRSRLAGFDHSCLSTLTSRWRDPRGDREHAYPGKAATSMPGPRRRAGAAWRGG